MNAASSVPTRSPRLHSLDALRGLDIWPPEIRKTASCKKPRAR